MNVVRVHTRCVTEALVDIFFMWHSCRSGLKFLAKKLPPGGLLICQYFNTDTVTVFKLWRLRNTSEWGRGRIFMPCTFSSNEIFTRYCFQINNCHSNIPQHKGSSRYWRFITNYITLRPNLHITWLHRNILALYYWILANNSYSAVGFTRYVLSCQGK